jgi:hypothetical protein
MSIREKILELAGEEQLMFADGFDDAIVGVVERFGQEAVVLYDRTKYLDILMRGGMTEEEAGEWFSFNVIGAWVGDLTPAFATLLEDA